ncbi:CGCGG family rSAM-modified RiPP protein [Haloarchaeobius sp. HME9146]|uniref:CGCGG family putative rSAM-modified RiPP protein n=1 Tax=Haloarchaeobius sp. HME9146 TaxID=2978732 RepID=UPI0021C21DE9|nr:CGCGG family rSAM-modified RiPP protein [Haloarchaeobius sp. HME9146]MCT9097682.1 CGCGG family rSAM-modified RiPP protein [Haloarchaeobius sp. HME9146]
MSTAPFTDAEPITDHVHHNSWSANLELPRHAEDRELVVAQAIEAVEFTASDTFVNLVTHANHGHPSTYLFGELDAVFGDDILVGYVEECGCGGHVTRVVVK